MMAIDEKTFGGSPAAVILASRLNEMNDERLTHRVSAFLDQTFSGYSALSDVTHDGFFKTFIRLWRDERVNKVNFHPRLDSYVKNLVVAASRDWIRGDQED